MREVNRESTSWKLLAMGTGFVAIVAVALVIAAAHRGFEPGGKSAALIPPPTGTSEVGAAISRNGSKPTAAATKAGSDTKATPTHAAKPKRTPTPKSTKTSTRASTPTATGTPRPASTQATTQATAAPPATATATTVATPTSTPTTAAPQTYVIQNGDTLSIIAQKFNVTVQALTQLNHIADPNYIQAGTTIKIPPH